MTTRRTARRERRRSQALRWAMGSTMRWQPELPAAPQLPTRTPLEGMIAQWVRALPEVTVASDGSIERVDLGNLDAPIICTFDPTAHGGLLAFLTHAQAQPKPPRLVK